MGPHHYFSATTSQAATKSFTYHGRRMERIEEKGGLAGGSRSDSAQLQRSSSGLLPPPRFTSATAQICRRCLGSTQPLPMFNGVAQVRCCRPSSPPSPPRFPAVAAKVPRRRRPGSPPRPPRFTTAAQFTDAAGVVARPNRRAFSLPRSPGYSGEGNFFWIDRAAGFQCLAGLQPRRRKKLQAAFSGRSPANKATRAQRTMILM
jgi:hypothetical protein